MLEKAGLGRFALDFPQRTGGSRKLDSREEREFQGVDRRPDSGQKGAISPLCRIVSSMRFPFGPTTAHRQRHSAEEYLHQKKHRGRVGSKSTGKQRSQQFSSQ